MWLAAKIPQTLCINPLSDSSLSSSFLDLCLHLGPEVFTDKNKERVFIPLASVANYWQLSRVLSAPHNPRHPFVKYVEELARAAAPQSNSQEKITFVIAPSPSLAAWGLENLSTRHTLNVLTNIELQKAFQQSSTDKLISIFTDQLQKSSTLRSSWFQMIDTLQEIGIKTALQLKRIFQDMDARKEFYARFPEIAPLIHRRLILAGQDFSLQSYIPDSILEHRFHPALEEALSSDASQDLLLRIESLLRMWQLRLESRKSTFRSLEITLSVYHTKGARHKGQHSLEHHPIDVEFPRGLRDSVKVFELVKEKFSSFNKNENALFDQSIEEVCIRAKRIERLDEKQLSLFEHEAEDNFEKWKLLLARIQMRSKQGQEIRVGTFEAGDSYWPEQSFEWRDWDIDMPVDDLKKMSGPKSSLLEWNYEKNKASNIDSPLKRKERYLFQPPRPMLFLEEPENLLVSADKLEDYIDFLKENNALSSLESLASPWGQHNQVRYYARIEDRWVFWDSQRKKIFLHGYFEKL